MMINQVSVMVRVSKEMVIEFESRILRATQISDVAVLNKLLHDDLIFHLPNGAIVNKSMDIRSHETGNMAVELFEVFSRSIKIVEDVAIVSFILVTKGKMMGEPIKGKFRFLRIWKLCDGELRVVGGSCIRL